MIEVVLIRHGKTLGNIRKAYIGVTDEDLYETQELSLAKYPKVERVFTSPLKRCIQTANLIYPKHTSIPVADLSECDFGDFDGKNYDELKTNPHYQAWLDSGGEIPFPNGENPKAFKERCVNAFLEIILQALGGAKTIAIVCHGGTIMAILERFSHPNQSFYHWQVDNLSGFRFNFDESQCRAENITAL